MENVNNNTLAENFSELETAFKMKKWLQLDDIVLETLVVICELNGNKNDIYNYLFKGAPHKSNYGQQVWESIDKKVKHFHFHNDLKTELQEALPALFIQVNTPEKNDTFKFSLRKETNKIIKNQPEYSGIFRLQKSIYLKEGQEYSYGGWTNDDGSIFIKIIPVENNIMINLDIEKEETQVNSKIEEVEQESPSNTNEN